VLLVVDNAEKTRQSFVNKSKSENIIVIDLNTPLNSILSNNNNTNTSTETPANNNNNNNDIINRDGSSVFQVDLNRLNDTNSNSSISGHSQEHRIDVAANRFRSVSVQSDPEAKKRIYGFLFAIAKGECFTLT